MSLRLRLVLAGSLAIVLALGIAAIGLSSLFRAHVEQRMQNELLANLDQILAGLDITSNGLAVVKTPADPRFNRPYGGEYWQIILPGKTLRSRSLWDTTLVLGPPPASDGAAYAYSLIGPRQLPLLAMARSVTLPARLGGQKAIVIAAIDQTQLTSAQKSFIADLKPYTLLLALALITAGWIQVTVGLRPLASLGRRVSELQADPARRMGTDWPSDVRLLASKVDGLLDARAVDLERARMRAADLAHGLKTPLQALMGEAGSLRDAGMDAVAKDIEDIVQSMRNTVDRELIRARTQNQTASARANPQHVAAGVVAVVQKTPDGRRISWSIDIPADLCVALDEIDLADALGAVIENAARHAQSKIDITAHRQNDQIVLTVSDDGPGIPADQRDAMLMRFGRADERGNGLGLAIANEIAVAAGGEVRLLDATPGLRAELCLRSCE